MEKQFVEMDNETFAYFSERAKEDGIDISEYLHRVAKNFEEGVTTPLGVSTCTACA